MSGDWADVAASNARLLVAAERELEAAMNALPDPGRLALLAEWLDLKYPDEPDYLREVQYDLRSWANRIEAVLRDAAGRGE